MPSYKNPERVTNSHWTWDQMKFNLIGHWNDVVKGVDEPKMPMEFEIGQVVFETFRQILRPATFFEKLQKKQVADREVSRTFIVSDGKLLIHRNDQGEEVFRLGGMAVKREYVYGQIGGIHTHPIHAMPSSPDILQLITGSLLFEFVVTPEKVIFVIRTSSTPLFNNELAAKGYITKMGQEKGKAFGLYSQGVFADLVDDFTIDLNDLKDLNILCYEAKRNSRKFVRK